MNFSLIFVKVSVNILYITVTRFRLFHLLLYNYEYGQAVTNEENNIHSRKH
jgi:hypothetical protein